MACSNIQPIQLAFQNISLNSDFHAINYGVALEVGTPPQILSLTPTPFWNNTFVNPTSSHRCNNTNDTCLSITGGLFDYNASSSYVYSGAGTWNGSPEGNQILDNAKNPWYFNDILEVAGHHFPGFPFATQSNNQYGILGLGNNSTFMNALLDAKMIASRSYSFYAGMYSVARQGMLMLGGYGDRYYTGKLITAPPRRPWLRPQYNVSGLVWQTQNTTLDLIAASGINMTEGFQADIDPYFLDIVLPDAMFWAFGNATNASFTSMYNVPYLTYNASNIPAGNLVVTLDNGLKTTIPNHALFDPPAYDNAVFEGLRNGSADPAYALILNFGAGGPGFANVTNVALFGMPYAAFVYIVRDYERHLDSIANADPNAFPDGPNTIICPLATPNSSNSSNSSIPANLSKHNHHSPSHVGAIAGGVIGGVIGVAALLGLAWFVFAIHKRKKKRAAAQSGRTTTKPAEMGDPNLDKKDSREMFAESRTTSEMEGTKSTEGTTERTARELPAHVELP